MFFLGHSDTRVDADMLEDLTPADPAWYLKIGCVWPA